MPLFPTPLSTTLDHLLASEARVSTLVEPAFGFSASEEPGLDKYLIALHEASGRGEGTSQEEKDKKNKIPDTSCLRREQEIRVEKNWIRVRWDCVRRAKQCVRWARCSVVEFKWLLAKWESLPEDRKGMVEARELAAVLGAGAAVFDALETTLGKMAGFHRLQAKLKTLVSDQSTGNAWCKEKLLELSQQGARRDGWAWGRENIQEQLEELVGSGEWARERLEEQKNALALLQRETQRELWEILAGLECLQAALGRVREILERCALPMLVAVG